MIDLWIRCAHKGHVSECSTIYIFRMMERGLGVSVRHFVSPRAVAHSKMVS